jgi:hypothetical protein
MKRVYSDNSKCEYMSLVKDVEPLRGVAKTNTLIEYFFVVNGYWL